MKKALCCYCGIRVATTKDHIPPKSIFKNPRPGDLTEAKNHDSGLLTEAFLEEGVESPVKQKA